MLIDWFTVIAQAVNFFILMYLLKRFLYRPILDAIDAREAHIAETVRSAEEQQKAAEMEHAAFTKKNEEFDRQRADLISQAREDAKAMGEQYLDKERQAVNAVREKWRSGLADEQERFSEEAVRRIQEEIFAIVQQVFTDLADTSLENRMVEVFGRRLSLMPKAPGDKLDWALKAAKSVIRVKSAFNLSVEQQASLRQALAKLFAADVDVVFETEPNLIGGIELIIDGQKIAWTITDYLDKLKNGIADLPSSLLFA